MRIAEGEFDLYVHPSRHLMEWDTCAPELILGEAGGTITDCLGAPLLYNKSDPSQPGGILASGPGVAATVTDVVRRLYRRED
jgi:myo-inositol-1(or 4)-monophosphatase